jgi:hypothetical protein
MSAGGVQNDSNAPSATPAASSAADLANSNRADADANPDPASNVNGDEKGAPASAPAPGVAAWRRDLLKRIIGEDSVDKEEFDRLINKVLEDGEATPEDTAALTKIMYRFLERLAPTTTGQDEEVEGMDASQIRVPNR